MLHLSLNNIDDKTMELLSDELKHPKCAIDSLRLDVDILTESYIRHLAELLRKNQRITMLDLSFKNPDDRTMELLCDGLKHPECTIEILQIAGEILAKSSMKYLAEVLRKNQSLAELHLSINNLDDKTMELLCDELKHPECAIETL
ncbi:NACHT, LRR and PYD domains-containing protein 4E, partial [Ophiophagus hannah]